MNTPDRPTRTIRRYNNRKLYDVAASRYVTLAEIANLVREGEDVNVEHKDTQADLTSVTLAQIICEEEKLTPRLPAAALRKIIREGLSA